MLKEIKVLSTDQGMTYARNATDAHAQGFEVNSDLRLPILKAVAQCTHYTLHGILDVFILSVLVEEPVDHTSTSPIAPSIASSPPRTSPNMPTPMGRSSLVLWSVESMIDFLQCEGCG
jgi:hypothetical protein